MEVSLKSAQGLYSFIDKERYLLYIAIVGHRGWYVVLPGGAHAPIDKNDFSFTEDGNVRRFDFAYITIHGTPGENGLLQGYFDLIGMPYSSCGTLASALTFNKYVCNHYLKGFDIRIADSILLRKGQSAGEEEVVERLGLPVFVKPNDGGSSFGITKVKKREDLQPAIEKAFAEGSEVVVERFVGGTEVTCGCYKVKGKEVILPLTEVVSKNEFFDYKAKYNGESDEITPARLSGGLADKVRQTSSRIYDIIGAKGLIRVDYIITKDGCPVLLEINTTPGMTATSFIPQQVKAAGLNISDIMTEIIENELN